MSTPDQGVGDGERRHAKGIVNKALAEGRIIAMDRDKRLEQIEGAHSLDEIRMIIRDLDPAFGQAPHQFPTAAPTAFPQPTPTSVNYGPSTTSGAAARRGCLGCALPLIIAIIVIGAVGLGIFSAVRDGVDGIKSITSDRTYAPGVDPQDKDEINVISVQGYQDLVEAIETANGRREAFSLVMYPTYAVIQVPVDATSGREQSYYWNGQLDTSGSKGTTEAGRLKLDDVDPAVVVRLVKKVRRMIDDPRRGTPSSTHPRVTGRRSAPMPPTSSARPRMSRPR